MNELFLGIALLSFILTAAFAFAFGVFLALSPAQLHQWSQKRPQLLQPLEQLYHRHYELTVLVLSFSILCTTVISTVAWLYSAPGVLGQTAAIALLLLGLVLAIVLPIWSAPVSLRYWFAPVAQLTLRMIRFAQQLALPFQWMLRRHYDVAPKEEDVLEELDEMIESAREEGQLGKEEYQLLRNVLVLSEIQVSDIMTPRTVVFFLPADMTVAAAVQQQGMQQFSRIPITEGKELDTTVGYVMSRDVLWRFVQGQGDEPLVTLKRPIHTVPEMMPLDVLLEEFLRRKEHLFMVVDEFGGVEGLVTLEDVIETLLGVEIIDEADQVVDLREVAKRQKQKRLAQQMQQVPQSGSEK